MSTLSNVETGRGQANPPSVRVAPDTIPEAKSSQTGVSVKYVPTPDKSWYVFRASYGREDRASDYIVEDGTFVYIAKRYVRKTVNGKQKKVLETLIPNLLFVYSTEEKAEGYVKRTPALSFLTYYYNHFELDKDQKNPPLTVSHKEMENFIIATCNSSEKFLPRTEEEITNGIDGRQHVLSNIDSSLQHLGMDYVDLYIYHIWDYKTPAEEILEGMNEAVRAGKARYIGIANAYAYQVAKMNAMAEKNGWAKFISVQNHYNLIMREEEREMFPFCREESIAMTPYSALASGKLAKRPGETSKRQAEDSFMHFKYDATAEQDNRIVNRVVELANRYDVEMTQISLAWLLTKVESPIVGATKLHHIEGAVKTLDVRLTADDIRYLEEPYVPHNLSGVMAVNKPAMSEEPVWVKAAKNK